MKIYYVKDTLSGQVVHCFLAENIEVANRTIRNMMDSLIKNNNVSAVSTFKDCWLYESEIDLSKKMIEIINLMPSDSVEKDEKKA